MEYYKRMQWSVSGRSQGSLLISHVDGKSSRWIEKAVIVGLYTQEELDTDTWHLNVSE